MPRPYSIKIFLPGGDPDGLRTIEKSNWSGAGIVVPRALIGEARQRRELARTGVYVLVGPPEESGLPPVYIGEGDPIRPRLEQHAAKKDFWTTCVAFTSKEENLNKAHVQFLESRLVDIAKRNKRCLLDNGNVPTLPSLSESDAADAEGFLAEMLLCLPTLGINVFTVGATPAPRSIAPTSRPRASKRKDPSFPRASWCVPVPAPSSPRCRRATPTSASCEQHSQATVCSSGHPTGTYSPKTTPSLLLRLQPV